MIIIDELFLVEDAGGPQTAVFQRGLVAAIRQRQVTTQPFHIVLLSAVLRHLNDFI